MVQHNPRTNRSDPIRRVDENANSFYFAMGLAPTLLVPLNHENCGFITHALALGRQSLTVFMEFESNEDEVINGIVQLTPELSVCYADVEYALQISDTPFPQPIRSRPKRPPSRSRVGSPVSFTHDVRPDQLAAGDHIYTEFCGGLICHHGIVSLVAPHTMVIHWGARDSPVICQESTLEQFLNGGSLKRAVYGNQPWKLRGAYNHQPSDPDHIIRRARLCLTNYPRSESYNLLTANCEHFAVWCVTGKKRSAQVEVATKALSGLADLALARHFPKYKIGSAPAMLVVSAVWQGLMYLQTEGCTWEEVKHDLKRNSIVTAATLAVTTAAACGAPALVVCSVAGAVGLLAAAGAEFLVPDLDERTLNYSLCSKLSGVRVHARSRREKKNLARNRLMHLKAGLEQGGVEERKRAQLFDAMYDFLTHETLD
eukprot:c20496_g1_i2.p1 GENE.c20496_g1_i2~~c20496_g1_i2.p1  ORF type:complete len:503 (-),score=71.05 c20496_g1_i2:27-1310(-)